MDGNISDTIKVEKELLLSYFFKKKNKKNRVKRKVIQKNPTKTLLNQAEVNDIGIILARFPYNREESIDILIHINYEGLEFTEEEIKKLLTIIPKDPASIKKFETYKGDVNELHSQE